jgi:predicted kinase
MLIVFGGLPGAGKTTVDRALARRLKAVHVRVGTIEPIGKFGRCVEMAREA